VIVKKILSIVINLSLVSSVNAGMLDDLSKNVSGGKLDLKSLAGGAGLDLKSLGLDSLNLGDIATLNLGAFTSALSLQCNYSLKLPKFSIPTDVCNMSKIKTKLNKNFNFNFNFSKSLKLGKCKATASGGGGVSGSVGLKQTGAQIAENLEGMRKYYCGQITQFNRVWSQTSIVDIGLRESLAWDVGSKTKEVSVESAYLPKKAVKVIDTEYTKGYHWSDLYAPQGILGFDKIYKSDKDLPDDIIESYNGDDYETFNMYSRYAKSVKPSEGENGKFVDFTKFEIEPSSYAQYISDLQMNVRLMEVTHVTMYELEQAIKNELDVIKKKIGQPSGSSSIGMKADYISKKGEMLKELTAPKSELGKALVKLKNYEMQKFNEEEEEYKLSHNEIVNPSNIKVLTKPESQQMKYRERMYQQQTRETRRISENNKKIKQKQGIMKLLAQKVFIANLEYNPSIAEKEIEEILGQ